MYEDELSMMVGKQLKKKEQIQIYEGYRKE